jgi:HlyD family secretion protein
LSEAETDAGLAQREFERAQKLVRSGAISGQEFDDAKHRAEAAAEAVKSAQSAVRIAGFELRQAEAAYTRSAPDAAPGGAKWNFPIHSPIDGRVLRVIRESATVVQPGAELIEVGDPADLEIWIDVLTTDAVKVKPGDEVVIEHWGGEAPLGARVRRIEPAGFTKISALGVEEKRTWIVADFTDARDKWSSLGDNFRIEARIVIWRTDDALRIPAGALLRHGDGWAVYRVAAGTAELRPVSVGHNNGLEAEILDGLVAGDRIVLYPGDRVSENIKVTASRPAD